jgi:opacity protein-like surface antigen
MRLRILLLTLASLAFSTPSRAETGTTLLGAEFQFPIPSEANTQLGAGAGVTFTHMLNAHVGFGLDLMDHYWPASPANEAAFNSYLRTERMESLQGSNWALSALQMTVHVRLAAPIGERYVPWMQVGAGYYRLNLNLDEQRPAGTYSWVEGTSNVLVPPGWYGGAGLDFRVSSPVVLGVDATYHYVWSYEKSDWGFTGINDFPDFHAFTVGMHVLFRWD